MTGFTGLDLLDNVLGLAFIVALATALTAAFGMEGAATAAALGIAGLNLVRLLQVRSRVGIQPYDRTYLGLALPAGAAALAAVAAQAALGGSAWWASLAVTAACGAAAYAALLPFVLPHGERAALLAAAPRFLRRPS
jgi:hypothetical protein